MQQYKKKNDNDPKPNDINPEIIRLARQNAFLRGPLELFLTGEVTWQEALETMLLLMMKEYKAQGDLLVSVIQEKPNYALMITDCPSKLIKALPARPMQ